MQPPPAPGPQPFLPAPAEPYPPQPYQEPQQYAGLPPQPYLGTAPAAAPSKAAPGGLAAMLPPGMTVTRLAIYGVPGLAAVIALWVGWVLYNSAAARDAATRSTNADHALSLVFRNETNLGDKITGSFKPLKDFQSNSTTYDANGIRQSIKAVQPGLDESSRVVEADRSAMRTALSAISERGAMTLLTSERLDKKQAQVQAALNGLDLRAEEIDTSRQQLALVGDINTALENFSSLAATLQAKDLAGAQSRFQPTDNAIKQAVLDAQKEHTPDTARLEVDALNSFMEATRSVMNSLQNRDFGEYVASLRVFNVQLDKLNHFDSTTVQKQYDELVKSYDDRYNAAMQDAGMPRGGGKAV